MPAIPAFLISILLSVASVGALAFYALWTYFPIRAWDKGKLLSVSIRQGALLAFGTVGVLIFGMLGVFSWWAALMMYGICILIEIALNV